MIKIVVRIKEGESGFNGIDFETLVRYDSTKGEHAIAMLVTNAISNQAHLCMSGSPVQLVIDGDSEQARKIQKERFDNI